MTESTEITEKPRPWHQSLLLAVAIGVGALVVGAAIAITALVALPHTTGFDLLPAGGTIVVIAGNDVELRTLLQTVTPGLSAPLAQTGSGHIVALLALPNGTEEWISLPRGTTSLDDSAVQMSAAARAFLHEQKPLTGNSFFAALASDSDGLFFADVPWLRAHGSLHPFVAAALTGHAKVGLTHHSSRWRVTVDGPAVASSLPLQIPLAFPAPLFSLAVADAPAFLQTVISWQQPEAALITDGLARAFIARTLGPGALTGSVLESLRHTTLLSIASGHSGGLLFAASAPSATSTSGAALLIKSFSSSLPRAIVEHIALDDHYSVINARIDEAGTSRTDVSNGAWTTTTILQLTTGRQLSVAHNPATERLTLSNDTGAILALQSAFPTENLLPLDDVQGSPVAAGVLRPALLAPLLPPSVPSLLTKGLLKALPTAPLATWNLGVAGPIWTLTLDLAS